MLVFYVPTAHPRDQRLENLETLGNSEEKWGWALAGLGFALAGLAGLGFLGLRNWEDDY